VLQGHQAQAGAPCSWPEDKEQLPDTQGKEGNSCQEEVIFLPGRIRHTAVYFKFYVATVLFSIPSFDAVIDESWGYDQLLQI
jgi:hypothetical protein